MTEMEAREKAKDKIKKLLTLAGNNPNENEAQSAILKAQQMLLEFKIEEHELEGEKAPEITIIEARCDKASNTAWEMKIAHILEENFGVILFFKTRGNVKTPIFFGEEDKANICKSMYEFIAPWLNKRACNYATKIRNTEGIVKGVKQDFILGFLNGLADKFKEQVATSESYALVVVINPLVKNAYEDRSKDFKKGGVHAPKMTVHGLAEARAAGYQEGKTFSTNAVTGGTRQDAKLS
jgi:hypothetical protein